MKVLVIGSDPNLFKEGSEVRRRSEAYAALFGEYHVVSMQNGAAEKPKQIGNLFLWPTNSRGNILKIFDTLLLGRRIIKTHGIDVIDAQDASEAGLIAWTLARLFGLRLRIQVHTDVMSPFYRKVSPKERLRYILAKLIIPRANSIRVVSERIKRGLLQATSYKLSRSQSDRGSSTSIGNTNETSGQTKITVLPVFTDVSVFVGAAVDPQTDERFKPYGFKMIAVGRFVDKEKNFSMLIDIMRDFVRVCPSALLVLVGDGPDRENYKLQITNYKLERNIIIETWRNDLPSYYKSFDLFLLSSNYEGWGRVVVEAMAAGLPVLMTDVGLAGEVLKNRENGLVVPVGRKDLFFLELKRLYGDIELRKKLAEAGQKTALSLPFHDWPKYLMMYKQSLEQ